MSKNGKMKGLSLAVTAAAAAECFGIAGLEMFGWKKMGNKIDPKMTPEFLESTVSMAANQGFYNALLGAVGAYGVLKKDRGVSILFLSSVLAAAAFGSATVDRKVLLKQGTLPAAALGVVLAGGKDSGGYVRIFGERY